MCLILFKNRIIRFIYLTFLSEAILTFTVTFIANALEPISLLYIALYIVLILLDNS
jgi:hypothetical protein